MAPIKTPLTNYIHKNHHSLFIEFPCICTCNLLLGAEIQPPPPHTLGGENILYYYTQF